MKSTQKLLSSFLGEHVDSDTLHKLYSIYSNHKHDFLEGFEIFINSFIDTEFASIYLYKTYANLKSIQSDRQELQDSILELIVNLFLRDKGDAILFYFFKQSNDICKNILAIFISKLIQFNYDKFIEYCNNFSKISSVPLAEIMIIYFEKNKHKFNLFFEQFDVDLKLQIYELSFKKLNSISHIIEDYLSNDLFFQNKILDHLHDESSLVKSFVEIKYSTYRAYPKFLNLLIQNVDRLPKSFQKMIDNAQHTQNYSMLISLAQPGYKRQILQILVDHGTEYLIKEFITVFRDDPEIKALVAFI